VTMQHETVPQSSMQHPPMHMSQQEHPGAPPMQHETFSGGHQWHSGDHYTGSRHYVSNWNSYRLSPPPSGYQWVQDGSQFVLIAIATGVITSVIVNSTYQ
jgi:Ni/Co efflux regulator RcnB